MNRMLSKHFSSNEFRCHDGTEHEIAAGLLDILEAIREHFGQPVVIVSGYRSPAWNKRVKGAANSFHCKGMAADIQVLGTKPETVYQWVNEHHHVCGLGLYCSWVHVDCRGSCARWEG
jgi:uncharacterized protein YcbK (DUF882 family)